MKSDRFALRERIYRRRYLVPNLVTIGNMFCGYLSMVYSTSGRYEKAVIAIAFAILLDGLDGRVARKLNATSKFGMEFDSFSDVVSFGIAPAMLVYNWIFRPLADEFGVFVTFLFALCAASRLARFNLTAENLQSFNGLPTPGAAGAVLAVVYFLLPIITAPNDLEVILASILMLTLAYLMISNIEFFSIKSLKMHRLGISARVTLGALLALCWYNSRVVLLIVAIMYCLSGPLGAVLGKRKKHASSIPT